MCSAKISPKLTSSLKKYTAVATRLDQIESHNLIFIMPVVNTQHGGRTVRPAHISHWALCAKSIARGTFIYQRPFLCTLISRVQLISANPFVSVMSISGRNFCVACKTLWELVFGRNQIISRFPPKACCCAMIYFGFSSDSLDTNCNSRLIFKVLPFNIKISQNVCTSRFFSY